jgi:hypothetical protein
MFSSNWPSSFRDEDFLNFIPFFIFSNSDHVGWRSGLSDTILEGITHEPFHQSLVSSGQVVSEENIFSNCVRTDDRRKVMTKAHLT